MTKLYPIKVCLNRYSWGAGKVGSEYSSWFIRLVCMQIGLKMEAGDCPTLNMNAMEDYLLSHSLKKEICTNLVGISDDKLGVCHDITHCQSLGAVVSKAAL